MDLNPLLVNCEIRQAGIDPAACIVVMNSVLFDMDGVVRVAAEDAAGAVLARVVQSSGRNLG